MNDKVEVGMAIIARDELERPDERTALTNWLLKNIAENKIIKTKDNNEIATKPKCFLCGHELALNVQLLPDRRLKFVPPEKSVFLKFPRKKKPVMFGAVCEACVHLPDLETQCREHFASRRH